MFARVRHQLGRVRVRLLVVNALVLIVPIAGLEFARLFERELLRSLERDMQNQASVIRRFLEAEPTTLFDESRERILSTSAESTRTRVRILDTRGATKLDSHRFGPPEGEEAPTEYFLGRSQSSAPNTIPWRDVPDRSEVKEALRGRRGSYTRIRERGPSVFLFIAEPLLQGGRVVGVVYITRSTQPVMAELYRIRWGLQRVLVVALLFTVGITLWLAHSITRPLERLSRVAARIAGGETELRIPISGSGEVRELGHALERMTERLRQRLRDTAAFAADVAHGFKSPLTSIRGAAELLAQGAADDPPARARFLANIELDSERLDRLVTRLLQLGRIEASTEAPQGVDLIRLLPELAARSSTPDVSIVVRAPNERVEVRGRKEDLATAVVNLLDNAVRHSPHGAVVEVQLSVAAGFITIAVTDTGPGVPPQSASRLFERFFTTDADHGTGLGLAIVKSVAEAHGGRAYFVPSNSGGARFTIELPETRRS